MKRFIFIIIVGLLLYLTIRLVRIDYFPPQLEPSQSSLNIAQYGNGKFSNAIKTPHYISSIPEHASILAAAPINIVIQFDAALAGHSTVSIIKDGKEYGDGIATIDTNKLSLRRFLRVATPDGLYDVHYSACWTDQKCDSGQFQFVINSKLLSGYIDMRHQKSVDINISHMRFNPSQIRISKGTTVNWHNSDTVQHSIRTDPYPADTYFPPLNSTRLNPGESFSYIFDMPGLYPYHCDVHPKQMTSDIVVD